MSDVVKVSWSGGKDSTCAVLKHLEKGHKVKAVYYVPMFTETIPLILKQHYEFIQNTAEYFKSLGVEVFRAEGITYVDYVQKRSSRGKFKGRMFGFPLFFRGKCGFNRDSKSKALSLCDVGYFDYEDIGIAADEKHRLSQLNVHKRSILNELGITEPMAKLEVSSRGLLSPHYCDYSRDGCALCPNATPREREQWFSDYPEAVPILENLQEIVKKERPGQYPLRNHEWFL